MTEIDEIPLKNSGERYGWIAMGFHWVIGPAIIFMLGLGLYMDGLPLAPKKFELIGLHKSIGVTILTLALFRLLWRLRSIIPALPAHVPQWQKLTAHATHWLLYAAMFAMPLSGWAMSSAAGFPVSVFGWFTLPPLVGADPELKKLFGAAHSYIAWSLIALIVLHGAAALKHHFIDKDNVLKGMLPCEE